MRSLRKQLESVKGILPEEQYDELEKEVEKIENELSKIESTRVPLFHKVKIIKPICDSIDKRMDDLIGHTAICVGYNKNSPKYYYHLWFSEEESRKIYNQGGGIFFNPSYIENLGYDENMHKEYENYIKNY